MRYKLKNLTNKNVAKVLHTLVSMHDGEIVRKKDAWYIRLVAKFMPLFSPISEDDFLNDYTQTLPGRVLVSFEPGDESTGFSHEAQLRIITHETGHLDQFNRDVKMSAKYLLRPALRALLEAQCFAMNAQFAYFCLSKEFSTEMYMNYADNLINYSCDSNDIMAAFSTIESHCMMAKEMREPTLKPVIDIINIMKNLNMLEER